MLGTCENGGCFASARRTAKQEVREAIVGDEGFESVDDFVVGK